MRHGLKRAQVVGDVADSLQPWRHHWTIDFDAAHADLGAEVQIADGEDQRFGECKLLMVAVPSTESAPYFVSQSQGFVQRERTDAVFKQQ